MKKYTGKGFSFRTHERIDCEFLHDFTDLYRNTRPRSFYDYPLFPTIRTMNVDPLAVLGYVIVFAGRLLSRSKATRLLNRMEKQQEDLARRRQLIEGQLNQLSGLRRDVSMEFLPVVQCGGHRFSIVFALGDGH